jgi:23S rRNA pseudouridine1911/1915/1917 synthase
MNIRDRFIVKNEKFKRLDRFLAERSSDHPRMFWKREILAGNITVNGEKTKPDHQLSLGDVIEMSIEWKDRKNRLLPDKDVVFKIIFQSEDFVIIDKPAGISVHPGEKEKNKTLVNGLLAKFPQIKNVGEDKERPGIVHRLDKETSGLLVVALSQKAFEFFKTAFKEHKVRKEYIALAWGEIKKEEGAVVGYIGKSRSDPTRQSYSQEATKVINPKNSLTYYKVIKKNKGKTLVELSPKTGRMHQLRVHLHSIGHPIVGDKKYSIKKTREKNKKYRRHMLHAGYLGFRDWKGVEHVFQSPLPDDLAKEASSLLA